MAYMIYLYSIFRVVKRNIKGYSQVVRHQTLTLAFVGSNPAIPASVTLDPCIWVQRYFLFLLQNRNSASFFATSLHVAASCISLAATFLQKSPVRVFCRVSFFEKGHAALLLFDALLLSGLLPTIFGKVRAFESVCQKQKDIFCMAV